MLFELWTTFLALTRTTNVAARVFGVRNYLPALSAKRFSLVGGIDEELLVSQMDNCASFDDVYWANYWSAIALEHIECFESQLEQAGIWSPIRNWLEDQSTSISPAKIHVFLRRGAALITQTHLGKPIDLDELCQSTIPENRGPLIAADALLKAVAYCFIAAWPGHSPKRTKAYHWSRRLFDLLLDAIAPVLNLKVERSIVRSSGEELVLYGLIPRTPESHQTLPAALITNGLEGTNVEIMASFLRYQRADDLAMFFMEMPGTYMYKKPMKAADSERIYADVISHISSHKAIDSSQIGMVGISFGATWAVRMAIVDSRLKAIVANGAPLGRSLTPWGAFGLPQIIVDAIASSVGTRNLLSLAWRLSSIAPSLPQIQSISCPILAINGGKDTLISTQDTIDLANAVSNSQIKLYDGDDHCAMSHVGEWLDLCRRWVYDVTGKYEPI
ncbi:hypothetical protein QQS21_004766 [Conoideocrella luteorostrata]|uniref:Alpha/beta hydrolase n=1 Tax=Conoideocrella luteorostrata TaxID=1105319 RepID=A0AAJ0CQW6_9HYPO|nr:hypothetical protein QQS21_004766 [Conoideocrella luteorostrata]